MQANGKRKILIFSTAYYPFIAGAEVAIKEITDRLSGEFEFDLITAKLDKNLPEFEKIGEINVYRIGKGKTRRDKIFLPFSGALLALKLNRTRKYFCFWGVMASFGSGAGFIANILRVFSLEKKIPMVMSLQEGDSESHLKYKWFGLIAISWKLALRNTDKLTGLSIFLLERAKKNGFKGEGVLVPNGVDVDVFTREVSDEIKNQLINKLGKKPGDIFLVTSSRLTYKNGTDSVIEALQYLPENISFIVIGKGELGESLQKLADKLKVANRVKFLGFLPYGEIPKYLSVSDIFIRPSRSEGFGNSFIEAMASGLPVIATPVGGIPDFLDDKKTGIFCSPDNPKSIAQAVNYLINNHEDRQRIIANAKERVIKNYSWSIVAEKMREVFQSIN